MRFKIFLLAGSMLKLFIATAFTLITLAAVAQNSDNQPAQSQIYIKFKDNIKLNLIVAADHSVSRDQQAAIFRSSLKRAYNIVGMWRPFDLNNDARLLRTFRLDLASPADAESMMAELRQDPDLEYVERVPVNRVEYIPQDTLYSLQSPVANMNWQLDRIQAEQAWDITKGSPAIKVAIVDNAIWAGHPDLKNKIFLQRDVINNSNNSNPTPTAGSTLEWSHGTHTAGIAAGESDNGIGIASIGFNTKIIAVKAASDSDPNLIINGYEGVQWAANNGANVISMSWGGNDRSTTDQNIMNAAHNMGIVLVAAAGNDNNDTISHYPSDYDNVISVAATNEDDIKAGFSNYGNNVDISAPGGYGISGQPAGILSTTFNSTSYGNYDIFAGTSMATPMVAGLCSLILGINPNLSPNQVEAILKSTAENIENLNPQYTTKLGSGRINAYRAVSNTPFPPVANFTTPLATILPGTSINFTDLTRGIPSAWQWTFTGATPSSSTQKNPSGITYNTEGIYLVRLVSSNLFGTNTISRTGYITVSKTPRPVINFSASDTLACIGSGIRFLDATNYNPATWEWSFSPSGIEYAEGTTSASQNPVVAFSAPGIYNVSLTASNLNGSTLKTNSRFIRILGLNVPLNETFESQVFQQFILSDTTNSKVSVDARSADASLFGLHFQGNSVPIGWNGNSASTTHNQAWNENKLFHSQASICGINGLGLQGLMMHLDLKQTFSLGPKQCWFRVLVNGTQISDTSGTADFNPSTASSDAFSRKVFDLSPYAGGIFSLTFQAATRFADKKQGEGDNVMLDNIVISNVTNGLPKLKADGFGVYPNPSAGIFQITLPAVKSSAEVSIVSALGKTIYHSPVSRMNQTLLQADLSSVPKGIYMVILRSAGQILTCKLILQ